MHEIEAKILEVNRPSLEKILRKLGAKKYFEGEMVTIAYSMRGAGLRLRIEDKDTILMHKKVKKTLGVKSAEETPLRVYDAKEAKEFMAALGYKIRGTTTKYRIGYVLGEIKFDFDTYTKPKLPELLEIEGPSARAIYDCALVLGFNRKQCLPWTAGDLFNHYKVKP